MAATGRLAGLMVGRNDSKWLRQVWATSGSDVVPGSPESLLAASRRHPTYGPPPRATSGGLELARSGPVAQMQTWTGRELRSLVGPEGEIRTNPQAALDRPPVWAGECVEGHCGGGEQFCARSVSPASSSAAGDKVGRNLNPAGDCLRRRDCPPRQTCRLDGDLQRSIAA